jgi:hypothetical protein
MFIAGGSLSVRKIVRLLYNGLLLGNSRIPYDIGFSFVYQGIKPQAL